MSQPSSRLYLLPFLLLALGWIFPILWTAITSLRPAGAGGPLSSSLIFLPTLKNYTELFSSRGFALSLLNSLLIAGGATVISIFFACLAAYTLSRSNIAGRERIRLWILSLRMLPPISIIVPFYLMLSRASLLDSYAGLLIVYLSFSLPFAVWMLTGFFAEIPHSIDEAAALDGASPWQILFHFIVPLCSGGISVTMIFTFIFAWNEFLFAFLLTKEKWVTAPVRLGSTITPFQTDWGYLTAGAMVSFLPLVAVVFLLQRQMVRGISLGALR